MSRAVFRAIEQAKEQRNIIDRFVGYISPAAGARRFRSRVMMNLTGGYTGAKKDRRSTKTWMPDDNDADSDILPDLSELRSRSRDLVRNTPLATGAVSTKVMNVVGPGLMLQSRIDRGALGLSDEDADAWEAVTEREWRLFWGSKECDAARTLTGDAITRQVYRQVLENGDVFVVLPRIRRAGFPYDMKLQVVEADRVCNADNAPDSAELAGGVKKDSYGAPVEYHILKHHPGAAGVAPINKWQKVAAFGKKLNLRNVIHVFQQNRPGQSRGVPDLAPVIEMLKQLGRYTQSEIDAAVVSSFFTVFIESESGDSTLDLANMNDETGGSASDDDYRLASGAIVGLAPGEKVHDSNPGRPNTAFDAFVMAVIRQIGVALNLPFEILIKHFTASYSAARAAIEEAWKYYKTERAWLAVNFSQAVYEIWMYEAVALGRISAPGFFNDPIVRMAYLGSQWVGPTKGQIDELKEIKAAELRVGMGVSTLSEVTTEMTGGDWEKKHPQSVKEHNARKDAGLIKEIELLPDEPEENDDA